MTRFVDFSKFTSVRIGGVHEIFEVDSLEDLSSPHFFRRCDDRRGQQPSYLAKSPKNGDAWQEL